MLQCQFCKAFGGFDSCMEYAAEVLTMHGQSRTKQFKNTRIIKRIKNLQYFVQNCITPLTGRHQFSSRKQILVSFFLFESNCCFSVKVFEALT